MTRQSTVSKFLKSRPLWIVISIIVSIMLWTYVSSNEDDERTQTFHDVKLVFQGEDQLRDTKGIILTGVDTNSVSVTVTGSRRVISQLDSSKITAVVDISKISYTGNMKFTYDLAYSDKIDSGEITSVTRNPETISFTLDRQTTKSVEVRGVFNGTVSENFMQENLEFSPSVIKVSGPAEEIDKIDRAWVVIEKQDVDKTFTVDAPYVLMDKDGNELELDDVTADSDTVAVTLPIKATKEVKLAVDLIAGGGASEVNTVVTCEPSSVILSGDSDILDGINKISLGTIDLAEVNPKVSETYKLFIPNDTENISGVDEVAVTVEVKGLSTGKKTVTNFECIKVTEGYSASVMTSKLDVTVRAPESVLKLIASNNLRAVADLTEIGNATGVFNVPVEIYIDGYSDAGVIGKYEAIVAISENEE